MKESVVIGEYTWGGRDENECPTAMMMIEQLEVLGLQRGATAREVIKIMGELAEKYGYADGGQSPLPLLTKTKYGSLKSPAPAPSGTPRAKSPALFGRQHVFPMTSTPWDQTVHASPKLTSTTKPTSCIPQTSKNSPKIWAGGKREKFVFHKIYNPTPYGSPYYQQRREWHTTVCLPPA